MSFQHTFVDRRFLQKEVGSTNKEIKNIISMLKPCYQKTHIVDLYLNDANNLVFFAKEEKDEEIIKTTHVVKILPSVETTDHTKSDT